MKGVGVACLARGGANPARSLFVPGEARPCVTRVVTHSRKTGHSLTSKQGVLSGVECCGWIADWRRMSLEGEIFRKEGCREKKEKADTKQEHNALSHITRGHSATVQ